MSKICTNCGRTVNDRDNFCPDCRGTSFKNQYEVVSSDGSKVHKLFYWNYDGKYVISKAKVTGIITFLILSVGALASGAPIGILFFAVVISFLIFVICFAIHQMTPMPSQAKIDHGEYGLVTDLKHLFFFWQNNEGQYVLSKTKIISNLVFLLFFGASWFSPVPAMNLFVAILVGLFVEAPVFVVGYGIHKLTNSNPKAPEKYIEPKREPVRQKIPKTEKPKQVKSGIIPEYMGYATQLDGLNSKFAKKEKSTRNLIEKRFEPPQLTYTRFIGGVDKSAEIFKKQSDSAYTMINLADEYSPRIASEIESKIDIMESIIQKLDNLANELVLSDDISSREDVENVISEMDDLIDSVKDYDQ